MINQKAEYNKRVKAQTQRLELCRSLARSSMQLNRIPTDLRPCVKNIRNIMIESARLDANLKRLASPKNMQGVPKIAPKTQSRRLVRVTQKVRNAMKKKLPRGAFERQVVMKNGKIYV